MSSRFVIFLSLIVVLAGCKRESYSRSSSGFSSLDKKLLYDFRNQPAKPAQLDATTSGKVLSAVFPSYLSNRRQCKAGAATPGAGQIAPALRGAAEASFTAAGLKQTSYLMDTGECGQNPAATTRRLVIFTAGEVTANVQLPFGDAILGTYDLDGNGKHELLLEGGQAGPGGLIQTASLVEFDKDKLVTVEDLGQVYDDACGTTQPSKSVTARVVYYLPPPAGMKPRFTVELYRAPCPVSGQAMNWTRATDR